MNSKFEIYIEGSYWGTVDGNDIQDISKSLRKSGHTIKMSGIAGSMNTRVDAKRKVKK